jgi:hypothetical protein
MNVLEDRLRDELHALAELTQPDDIRPLREPARAARFRMAAPRLTTPIVRWLAPALAVAAVLGVVIAISVASGLARQRPALPASGTAAMPRFYITTQSYTHRWEIYVTATVHDSVTGAALITVPVWHRHGWQAKGTPKGTIQFPFADSQISVASNDRTFLINVYDLIYVLRIQDSGRSASVRQVHSAYGSVHTALSPDGKRIAVGLQFCFVRSAGCPPSVGLQILSATDDTVRSWFIPGGKDGTVDPVWLDSSHVEFFIDRSWRVLDVNTPGDSLLGDSRPTTTASPVPLITTTFTQRPLGHGNFLIINRVVRLSARTGKVVEVLRTLTQRAKSTDYGNLNSCEVLSVSSSGQALVDCDSFGRLDGRRFTPLPGFPPARASLNFMAPNAAW